MESKTPSPPRPVDPLALPPAGGREAEKGRGGSGGRTCRVWLWEGTTDEPPPERGRETRRMLMPSWEMDKLDYRE